MRTDRVENIQFTGGAIETPGNGYRYHFLTLPSHTFEITEYPGPVEYVLVGGGGSGGHYNGTGNSGGGGGAGGFLTGTFQDMAIGTYPVTVATTQTNNDGTRGDEGYSTIFNSTLRSLWWRCRCRGKWIWWRWCIQEVVSGGIGGGGGTANKMPDGTTNIPAALQPQGHAGGSQPLATLEMLLVEAVLEEQVKMEVLQAKVQEMVVMDYLHLMEILAFHHLMEQHTQHYQEDGLLVVDLE